MSKPLLEGVTCEKGTAKPQTPKQSKSNLDTLAKELGLGEKCQRASKTLASHHSTSGAFEVGVGLLGGLLGNLDISGNMQNSGGEIDDSFRESGCGSLLLDSKTIMDATRRMNCTLNQSSSVSNVKLGNRVSVQIRVEPVPGVKLKMIERIDTLVAQMIEVKDNPKIAEMINNQITALTKSIDSMGTLKITDSSIKASAGTRMKVMSQNVADVVSNLQGDYSAIVEASANNTLQQQAGKNAMQPEVKQLVQQRIETQSDDINSDMTATLSSTSIKVQQSGSIIITSPNKITLTNTKIDANSEIDMITSSLTTQSIELGKTIAMDLMTSAASENSMSTDNAGIEALIKAMSDGNAAAIKEQNDGLAKIVEASRGGKMMMIGMIVVALIPVLLGGKGKQGAKMPEGLTIEEQKKWKLDNAKSEKGTSGSKMPPGLTTKEQKEWKSKRARGKLFKFILGLTVKIIVIYNLLSIGPQLVNILMPWKWGQLVGVVKTILLNIIILMVYCVFVNKTFNPLICMLKF
jgi:hypothetical protein